MTLGETIRLLRSEQGLTQPELADKAQIEQSYLSKLENDKATPSFDIINRLALALGMNGMDLINRLSHSYIAEKLGHIPEVAAEYASIRQQAQNRLKRWFVLSSILVVLGVGVIILGWTTVLFPQRYWQYESPGVIREGETPWQFETRDLKEIFETVDEYEARLQGNRGRHDPVFMTTYRFKGNEFMEYVGQGGRRYYRLQGNQTVPRLENSLLLALGAMLVVSGVLVFVFAEKFRPRP